jgi:ATP-binding cassette subfamily B (MDR/TAP) protein 7
LLAAALNNTMRGRLGSLRSVGRLLLEADASAARAAPWARAAAAAEAAAPPPPPSAAALLAARGFRAAAAARSSAPPAAIGARAPCREPAERDELAAAAAAAAAGGDPAAAAAAAPPPPPPPLSDLEVLREVAALVRPSAHPQFGRRVGASLALLVAGKALNVQVPFLFKYTIDALAADPSGAAPAASLAGLALAPPALALAYGAARAGAAACNELRNAVFASVTQGAIRAAANRVFAHLLALDLAFHLSRQSGATARVVDRGTRGVSFLLSSMALNVAPTILEVGLVAGVLAYKCGPGVAALAGGTVAAYAAFTLGVTRWRTRFRREMNAAEGEAGARAADALINYETVKAFGGEAHEAGRCVVDLLFAQQRLLSLFYFYLFIYIFFIFAFDLPHPHPLLSAEATTRRSAAMSRPPSRRSARSRRSTSASRRSSPPRWPARWRSPRAASPRASSPSATS